MSADLDVLKELREIFLRVHPDMSVSIHPYAPHVLYVYGRNHDRCAKVQSAQIGNHNYMQIMMNPLNSVGMVEVNRQWLSPKGIRTQKPWSLPYRRKRASLAATYLFEAFTACGLSYLNQGPGRGTACVTCPMQLRCLVEVK